MADLKDTSAMQSLNEKDYINKLYDTNLDSQKKLLQQNFTDNTGVLDSEKQSVQKQTADNVKRTYVEAAKAAGVYAGSTGTRVSTGANAQAALTQGNAQQANVNALKNKQTEADAEIERQRSLLASQYTAAIKQAQVDNDMQRAQQLYDAAKAEDEQLLALRREANTLMLTKDDTSIQEELLKGEGVTAEYTGDTWDSVLKNEDSINEIYDKQLESEKLGLQMEHEEALSDLEAEQQKARAQTDKDLTQAYVDALRKMKNYAEVQTAYGQGSGTAAQARLAQDVALQKELTDLRGVQMGADAEAGMERFDLGKVYREQLAKFNAENNQKRAGALYDAAEEEEQTNITLQKELGQQLADKNDYSVLGKLYGLTQDQIDHLQGTGKYAPVYSYWVDDSGGGGGGASSRIVESPIGHGSTVNLNTGVVTPVYWHSYNSGLK